MDQAGWPLYKGVTAADVLSDGLIDKLRVLGYPSAGKIHRAYFVMELPGSARKDQFKNFMEVASWLIATPLRYNPPDPVEDPATRCDQLIRIICELGAQAPNWASTELLPGHGEAVCVVLDCLANMALTTVQFARPVHSADSSSEKVEIKYDVEADIVGLADTSAAVEEVEDEVLGGGGPHPPGLMASRGGEGSGFLTSRVLPTEWKIELERVRNQLNAAISADGTDWRMRIRDMRTQQDSLEALIPSVEQVMERTAREVKETLHRIQIREKDFNHELEDMSSLYRTEQDDLASHKARYDQLTETIGTVSEELTVSSRRLEKLKDKISGKVEAKGDLTPVAKAKDAIEQLHTEIKSMEVRIGVVRSNLVNVKRMGNSSFSDSLRSTGRA